MNPPPSPRRALRALALLAALLPGGLASAADYYVRATGSDSNPGTSPAQAWRTPQKAANILQPGDTVYIGAGTYSGAVRPARAGTPAAPIVYVADTDGSRTGDAGAVILQTTGTVLDLTRDNDHRFQGFVLTSQNAGAVVLVDNASGIELHDCTLRVGTQGLYIRNGGDVRIVGGSIEDITGDGVRADAGTVSLSGTRLLRGAGRALVAQNNGATVRAEGLRIESWSAGAVRAENGTLVLVDSVVRGIGSAPLWVQNGSARLIVAFTTIDSVGAEALSMWGGQAWLVNTIVTNAPSVVNARNQARVEEEGTLVWWVGQPRRSGTNAPTPAAETSADPLYRDRDAGDYTLLPGSPALTSGVDPAYDATVRDAILAVGRADLLDRRHSGSFMPDPDSGPSGPVPAEIPYAEDFENTVGREWSDARTDAAAGLTTFLGRFGHANGSDESATLLLATEPGRTYRITFDLYAIDSWDAASFGVSRGVTALFTASGDTTEIAFPPDAARPLAGESWGIDNVSVTEASEDADLAGGLEARWVWQITESQTVTRIDFSSPSLVTTEPNVHFPESNDAWRPGLEHDHFGLSLRGVISFPQAGEWELRLGSDDGAVLWIDGERLIDNDGGHAFQHRTGAVSAGDRGRREFRLDYFEWGGSAGLVLEWRGPGVASWTTVPPEAFARVTRRWAPYEDATPAALLAADPRAEYHDAAGWAWGDIDADGDLDAVVSGPDAFVLWNDGQGVFAPEPLGPAARQAALLDWTGDGRLDLYLAQRRGFVFDDALGLVAIGTAGVAGPSGEEGLAAGDADGDGWADILIFGAGGNWLARNVPADITADGPSISRGFSAARDLPTGLSGWDDEGDGDFVSSADVNGDALPDFFYHWDGGRLFLSGGDGTYTQDARGIAVATGSDAKFGSAWCDVDGDGDLDLVCGRDAEGVKPHLWINHGSAFTDEGERRFADRLDGMRSVSAGDYDSDGRLDLLFAGDEGLALFRQAADGAFERVTFPFDVSSWRVSDAVLVDADGDGDLDIAAALLDGGGLRLLRSTLADNAPAGNRAALNVRFVGAGRGRTNTAGVGVRIDLLSADGSALLARRDIGGARGFGGQEPLQAHFGGLDPDAEYLLRAHGANGSVTETRVTPAAASAEFGARTIPGLVLLREAGGARRRLVGWALLDREGAEAAVLRNRLRADGHEDTAADLWTRRKAPGVLLETSRAAGVPTGLEPLLTSGVTVD